MNPESSLQKQFVACLEQVLRNARKPVSLHEPEFAGNEWHHVKDCIDSGWVSSVGKYVDEFESRIADITGAKHAVAVVNGTTGLHVALHAAGVGAGDEVFVPALTFVATANAVSHCGAVPHFIDSEDRTFGMDPCALAARLALLDQARYSIDMQYYMVGDDSSTQLIIQHLLQAADRGVRLRLLVDDIYGLKRDRILATLSAHPKIEVRVFNPFLARGRANPLRLFEFLQKSSLNRRMHNKLLVVDNAALVVGGRNLGNEYFDSEAETEFTDLDVLTLGPVVHQASLSFDEYWNHPLAVPVRAFLRNEPSEEHLALMRARLMGLMAQLRRNQYPSRFMSTFMAEGIRSHNLSFHRGRARMLYDRPEKVTNQASGLFRGMHMAAD